MVHYLSPPAPSRGRTRSHQMEDRIHGLKADHEIRRLIEDADRNFDWESEIRLYVRARNRRRIERLDAITIHHFIEHDND